MDRFPELPPFQYWTGRAGQAPAVTATYNDVDKSVTLTFRGDQQITIPVEIADAIQRILFRMMATCGLPVERLAIHNNRQRPVETIETLL